jgi:nucleoside-diphosphate-sugar epimerase
VKFDSRLEDLIEQNVEATGRLIQLLDRHAPDAHFQFISTAYVHGRGSGIARECPAPAGDRFRHPYELTKLRGEDLVRELSLRLGRPFSIFRPSIIAGDSRSGLAANFNGIYSLLRLADEIGRGRLRGERATIECDPGGTKNIVPVDWVARVIVELTEQTHRLRTHGDVYHLTHPRPVGHRELLAMLGRITGFAGLQVAGKNEDAGRPARLQRIVDRSLRPFVPYLWDEPVFDRSNLERQPGGLSAPPPVDEGYLQRLIEFGRRVRWAERPFEGHRHASGSLSA